MCLTGLNQDVLRHFGACWGWHGHCIQLGWDGSSVLPLTLLQAGGGRLTEAVEGELLTSQLPGQLFCVSLYSKLRKHPSEVGEPSRTKMGKLPQQIHPTWHPAMG